MLREAALGRLSTRVEKAAWYCTMPDAISNRTIEAANNACIAPKKKLAFGADG